MADIKRVLGIESSCDECSLALVDEGIHCTALETYSQLDEHKKFGGVVPELASRLHVQHIDTLYQKLLSEHKISLQSIDAIAVTTSPGLSSSLMVGLHFAKALSLCLNIPFVAVDHIAAHFYSGRILLASDKQSESKNKDQDTVYPYIGVVVSGGHTVFAIVHDYNDIEVKGATIDDACGEVFDKIARELKLGYPGGPIIDNLAKKGDSKAATFPQYTPKQGYDISYSGLKTAVIHHRNKYWHAGYEQSFENIARTFSDAAIGMIVDRVKKLIELTKIKRVYFGGGVAGNEYLRKQMQEYDDVVFPPVQLCMDNAAMIAGLGYQYLMRGVSSDLDIGISPRVTDYRKVGRKTAG